MPALVDRDPLAAGLYYATMALWILSELRIMVRNRGGTGEDLDRGSRVWVVLLVSAGMVAASGLARLTVARVDGLWPVLVGVGLALSGVALRYWAVATLGSFFTTAVEVQADHHVVAAGPYALLRHPSYSGALLTVVGMSLALGSVLGCAAAVCLALAGLAQRIRVEEQALASRLGAPWAAYAQAHKRLIPLVW